MRNKNGTTIWLLIIFESNGTGFGIFPILQLFPSDLTVVLNISYKYFANVVCLVTGQFTYYFWYFT